MMADTLYGDNCIFFSSAVHSIEVQVPKVFVRLCHVLLDDVLDSDGLSSLAGRGINVTTDFLRGGGGNEDSSSVKITGSPSDCLELDEASKTSALSVLVEVPSCHVALSKTCEPATAFSDSSLVVVFINDFDADV